jgi:hypothetical protein
VIPTGLMGAIRPQVSGAQLGTWVNGPALWPRQCPVSRGTKAAKGPNGAKVPVGAHRPQKKSRSAHYLTKKMPIAGNKSADRARAHLRWAERYSKYGDVHKATSHFGRALDYTKSGFGTEHMLTLRGTDLHIEVTASGKQTEVAVTEWNGGGVRNINGSVLTIAALRDYAGEIGERDIEQLDEYLSKYGEIDTRVVFVDEMFVPHKDDGAHVPLELTYAALSFLLKKELISENSLVVIYKGGLRHRNTKYPWKPDKVPRFKDLGDGLLIARVGDLSIVRMNDDKEPATKARAKSRSRSPSPQRRSH